MRWPWQRREPETATSTSEHAAEQDARVEKAQGILDDARTHSDHALGRAQGILDDVRRAEKMLALYDDAEEERRGA